MRKLAAGFLGVVISVSLSYASTGVAQAQTTATNVQDGSNRSTTNQSGHGKSGAAVTGQVTGVVSGGGHASVDATNNSQNSTAQSGDANGSNHATSFTGLSTSGITSTGTAVAAVTASNNQTGDNTSTISQSSSALTGDGVAGQVIGVVTSGGSTSIVASNTSSNVDVVTGDANTTNDANAFVGLDASGITNFDSVTGCVSGCGGTLVTATAAVNVANNQTGDNRGRIAQASNSQTGDGVAGQVIGAVTSGGASSIDARNNSDNVSITTGDARSTNTTDSFVGLNLNGVTNTVTAQVCEFDCFGTLTVASTVTAANNQSGDNRGTVSQRANSLTGDGVGGQVIGAVTSGGSSSIVAANTSRNSDITTGDATSSNNQKSFVGLDLSGISNFDSVTGCFAGCLASITATSVLNASNTQVGDNRGTSSQLAGTTTGDGVGGQVIGAVTSGGASRIDANNATDNVDITTGDARSTNSGDNFVGEHLSGVDNTTRSSGCVIDCIDTVTIVNATVVTNNQDGDNRGTSNQAANATSGDGVGGQVIGAVTSGGSSSIVASNTSRNSDITSGDATSSNSQTLFVGLDASGIGNADSITGCFGVCTTTAVVSNQATVSNDQTGDNRGASNQAANATSGDGVGGQVIGAVTSGGASSIDARNLTDDVSVTSGDANASNDPTMRVGLNASGANNSTSLTGCLAFCVTTLTASTSINVANSQTGDNTTSASQAANASSGDGVGGQVIGAVTSGGSSSIVADNTTRTTDVTTGDASASNSGTVAAGLNASGVSSFVGEVGCLGTCTVLATVTSVSSVANTQTGDNRGRLSQAANASSGDGVGGQVIGAVTSGGASSIDGRNLTEDSSVTTGDAKAHNSGSSFVGLNASGVAGTTTAAGCIAFCSATITVAATSTVANNQVGDNRGTLGQAANASSGDGVGGEVIGAVTSGGSSSIVAANTTRTSDVTTGDANSSNSGTLFVGHNLSGVSNFDSATVCFIDCRGAATVTSVTNVSNNQTGNNRGTISQAANASTGDGVGGQVIGAVTSAGASSIDASNRTEDTSVTTGDSDATNSARAFVGLELASVTNVATTTFGGFAASTVTASNHQDGNNTRTTSQAANASSGDAVGGQVVGAVTSGGATSVVVANTTTGGNFESGHGVENNSDTTFVGLLALPLVSP